MKHLGALAEQRGPLRALGLAGPLRQEPIRLFPALRGQRHAGLGGEQRGIARNQRHGPGQLRGRVVEGAQVLLGHRRGPRPERGLLLGPRAQQPRRLGEQREQLPEGAHRAGQLLAAPPGLGVIRAGLERGGGVGERAARVGQPAGAQRRGIQQVARPLARIGIGRKAPRHQLQHGHLLAGLAGGGVGRGQHLGDAERIDAPAQQPLQERHRLGLLRGHQAAGGEERDGHAGRLPQPAQRLGQHLGPGQLQRGPFRVDLALQRQPRQHPHSILGGARSGPGLERGVEAPQRLLVVGALRQDLAPERGGAIHLPGVGEDPRQLGGEPQPFLAGGPGALLLQGARQLLLLAGAGHGGLQRGRRALVLGIELGERAPGPDRLLRLRQVVVQDLGQPAQQVLAGLEVGVAGAGRGPVGARQFQVRVGARRRALHGLAGGGAAGIDGQRAGQRPERLASPAQLVLLHLGHALQQPHPLGRVALPARRDVQHLAQPLPLAGLGQERRQGLAGRAEAGIGPQRRLQVPAGPHRIAQAVAGQHGGVGAQGGVGRLLRGGRQVALQRLQRLGEAPGVHLQLEGLQGRDLAGRIERQGPVQRRQRGLGVAEADQVHPRQLQQEQHLGGAIARQAGEPGQRVGVAAVVAALEEDPLQDLQRGLGPGRQRPGPLHPLHHPRQPLGIVSGVELRQAQVDRRGALPVLRACGGGLQARRLLAPGAGHVLEPLARGRGAGSVPVEGQRLDERIHGQPMLERLLDQGCPQLGVLGRQRARLGAVLARRVEQLLGLAEAAHGREAGERPDPRLGLLRVEAVRAGVQERGAVAAPEPLLVHLGEPQRQGGSLARVDGVGRGLLQHRGQGGPALLLLEELAQGSQRVRIGGIEAQELPVERLGAGDVPQLGVRQAGGARQQRGPRDQPGPPLVQRDQVLPA